MSARAKFRSDLEGEAAFDSPRGTRRGWIGVRRRGVLEVATPGDGEGRARGGKMDTPVEGGEVSGAFGERRSGVGAGEADDGGTGSARPTASDFAF